MSTKFGNTLEQLEAVASEELSEAVGNGALAAALDGSLATGKAWPSSDVDITVVPEKGDSWSAEWKVRRGIVIHKHITPMGVLDEVVKGYPQSFVEVASGEWFLDPMWLIDGLATLKPVYDPQGKLAAVAKFARERRFNPEVVIPRRSLLLQQAGRWRSRAERAFQDGDELQADWCAAVALDALAFIWLDAAERIASHKELDIELADACRELGEPEVHPLFRTAGGATHLADCPDKAAEAFLGGFLAYSSALDACAPLVNEDACRWAPGCFYHRHRLLSGYYAIQKGCFLHAADVRLEVARRLVWCLNLAEGESALPKDLQKIECSAAVLDSRRAILDACPVPPWPERFSALLALEFYTKKRFQVGGG